MRSYRIKQLSEYEYIAQVQLGLGNWFLNRWATILKYNYIEPDIMYIHSYYANKEWWIFSTPSQALEVCKHYEDFLIRQEKEEKEAKQYPKITKVKL
jgi:hypothetical protein